MNSFARIFSGLRREAQFFFIRHGESTGNRRGAMQGLEDSPLTDFGREQASRTGAWLKNQNVSFDRLFASPLQRAAETAQIVGAACGAPKPETLEAVRELDVGIFTGMSIPEMRERYPREFAEFTVGSWEVVPDAERVQSLTDRALQSWSALVDAANGGAGTIGTVSHGGFLQWIIKTSFGTTRDDDSTWMPLIKASNCAVFLFSARPAGPDWYYGQWSLMNFVPGAEPELGDLFHTDAR